MNTMHDFHASVESISQLWNLFNLVRNEGTFFTTLEFIYRKKKHKGLIPFKNIVVREITC
jgi:hypothetical protein